MKQVSKEEFFAPIFRDALNVHPTPVGACDDIRGYRSLWRFPNGDIYGQTYGGNGTGQGREYYLQEATT